MLAENSNGIFIIGRIKNFGSLKEDLLQNIPNTLTNQIVKRLCQTFPQYIFASINDKYLFCIIKNIAKEEQEAAVEDIQKVIETIEFIQDIPKLNINLGIANFPEDSYVAEEIFTKAYFALKSISFTDDRCYMFFHEFIKNQSLFLQNKDMAKRMKSAFNNNDSFLVFQPVINITTNQIMFHECMLKVEGDNDLLAIDDYIAAAEKFGFIKFIDELVLDLVVTELIKHKDIKLSVNISSFGIDNLAWLKKAKELLQTRDLSSRLIIEVSEKIIHKEFKKSVQFIRRVKELGCKVLIDNFGSGYTSFS
jgi:predicted signal transduction protein with EAL and GGDEF domain